MFFDEPTEEDELRLAELRKAEEKLFKTRQNLDERIREKYGGRAYGTGNRGLRRRTGIRSVRS